MDVVGYNGPTGRSLFKSISTGQIGKTVTPISDSNPFLNKAIVEIKRQSGSPLMSITPMVGQKRQTEIKVRQKSIDHYILTKKLPDIVKIPQLKTLNDEESFNIEPDVQLSLNIRTPQNRPPPLTLHSNYSISKEVTTTPLQKLENHVKRLRMKQLIKSKSQTGKNRDLRIKKSYVSLEI